MNFNQDTNYYLRTDIDRYFESKGIHVVYNSLGANEYLMRSFIKDYRPIVNRAKDTMSNHVKYDIYQTMYPVEKRKKLTGFEKVKQLDAEKRFNLTQLIKTNMFSPSKIQNFREDKEVKNLSYKQNLYNTVKKYDAPFVYLSGGADSEMLAYSLLDAGVKFKPVIFQLIYNNECINFEEIKYAFKFCHKEKLIPIVKDLNINEYWNSVDFVELAMNIQRTSPQIVTHAHMVELMDYEYPNRTHLFGGEVRYQTNHILPNDDEKHYLIYLDKMPWLQSGAVLSLLWESVNPAPAGTVVCQMYWNKFSTYANANKPDPGNTSGTFPWAVAPISSPDWYYQFAAANPIDVQGTGSGTYPGTTGYITVSSGFDVIQTVYCQGGISGAISQFEYTMNVFGNLSSFTIGSVTFQLRARNTF